MADSGKGRVRAGAMDSSDGIQREGIGILRGTRGADDISGTSGDDLIYSGGARPSQYGGAKTESIAGKGGSDTVIMNGQREDYVVSMPGPGEYPSERSGVYSGQQSLYGTSIVLTQTLPSGESQRYQLTDIARVGFDTSGRNYNANQGGHIAHAREGVADGSITFQSTAELRAQAESGMEPAERRDARLASTLEATRIMDGLGMATSEQLEAGKPAAIAAAAEAHPGIMNYPVRDPNPSTTENKLDALIGVNPAPTTAPVPQPR
jgi:hypothetical protein